MFKKNGQCGERSNHTWGSWQHSTAYGKTQTTHKNYSIGIDELTTLSDISTLVSTRYCDVCNDVETKSTEPVVTTKFGSNKVKATTKKGKK